MTEKQIHIRFYYIHHVSILANEILHDPYIRRYYRCYQITDKRKFCVANLCNKIHSFDGETFNETHFDQSILMKRFSTG